MNNAQKVLKSHFSSTPSQWREKAAWRRANRQWLQNSQRVAIAVLDCMEATRMTQKALAEKMGVSPQYVNKLLKGAENLSFETVAKLEEALNTKIMVIQNFFAQQRITPVTTWQTPKFIEIKPATEHRQSYKTTSVMTSCEEIGAA